MKLTIVNQNEKGEEVLTEIEVPDSFVVNLNKVRKVTK